MGRPVFVTACATCTDLLKKQLPDAEFVSLYELLNTADSPHTTLPFPEAAVFDPCAARHDGPVHDSVRALAEKAGCRTESLPERDNCCGFGGSYSVLYPEISAPILAKKIENIKESGADVVAMDCPGCMMQIRGGLDARNIDIKVKHTAEIIAEKRGLI